MGAEQGLRGEALRAAKRLGERLDLVRREVERALPLVMRRLEEYFGCRPSAEEVERYCLPLILSTLHVVVHEVAHAAVERMVEGLELSAREREALHEVMARLIERRLSIELRERLGLSTVKVESFEEQVAELSSYPELRGLRLAAEAYGELYERFWRAVEEGKPVEDLVREVLSSLEWEPAAEPQR